MHVIENRERLLTNDRVIVGMTLVLLASFGLAMLAAMFPEISVGVVGELSNMLGYSDTFSSGLMVGVGSISAAVVIASGGPLAGLIAALGITGTISVGV